MGDKAPAVVGTSVVFLILPLVAVMLRFTARRMRDYIGWDDWLIIPALVSSELDRPRSF